MIQALLWIERPLIAADLIRIFEGEFAPTAIPYRLQRLVSVGAVEVADARRTHGVTVRRYLAAAQCR